MWERELLFSNETHLEMALTALGHAIFPTFLLVFAALVGVFARHAHMGSGERRVVVGALGLWFLSS
ncbi:MAG: hypothetical protein QNK05_25660, partial [Myxococcota bacterium]|nr:hypothetical protein [Myxococcota bacterium]